MAKAWTHSRQTFPGSAVRAALAKASRCEELARSVSLWAPPIDAVPSDELRDWLGGRAEEQSSSGRPSPRASVAVNQSAKDWPPTPPFIGSCSRPE